MKITKGDCGGINFRNQYSFQVCQDGTYRLLKYAQNTSELLLNFRTSSAIHRGLNQLNVIAIVANGSKFDLYVNKQKIDNASDSTYVAGAVGLLATPSYGNPTEVAYSDVKVWTL